MIPQNTGTIIDFVYGGALADRGEYPWMVLVEIKRDGNDDQFCGGALITTHHVVTAGHCLKPPYVYNLEDIAIRLGVLRRSASSDENMVFRAEKMTVHYKFDSGPIPHPNDIGVVKLDRQVTFTGAIYPICLPKDGESFVGQEARVVGWGLVNGRSSGKRIINSSFLIT